MDFTKDLELRNPGPNDLSQTEHPRFAGAHALFQKRDLIGVFLTAQPAECGSQIDGSSLADVFRFSPDGMMFVIQTQQLKRTHRQPLRFHSPRTTEEPIGDLFRGREQRMIPIDDRVLMVVPLDHHFVVNERYTRPGTEREVVTE